MQKGSLGTIFLTVFLDLLGFGLVVAFLPRIAREYGASDAVATLTGTAFSAAQFVFVPIWGRLSDRVGRRPVLLWSIAASAIGMVLLGCSSSLWMLFAARLFSGAATGNIAVAQAYIADVTTPENRARGMGLIGVAFGLGFIFGPFIGGELGQLNVGRPGELAAFVAAGFSALNFALAFRLLPESLPLAARGKFVRSASPFDLRRFRDALAVSGLPAAIAVSFMLNLSFSGMEQIFALFSKDAFQMSIAGTGRVLGLVGVIATLVQGLAIRPLSRVFGETRLARVGVLTIAVGFWLTGVSPSLEVGFAAMIVAAGFTALGASLTTPSLSSYVSQRSDAASQGTTLGVLQSTAALGRVFGPATTGAVYQLLGPGKTYYVLAAEMLVAAALAMGLEPTAPRGR